MQTYSVGACYLFETGVAIVSLGVAEDTQPLTETQFRDIDTHFWNIMQTVQVVQKR
jgi:hypothetical protein